MSDETSVSKCCGAQVKVDSDGHPSIPFITHWHVCTKCHKPCDLVHSAQGGEGER